MMNNWPLIIFTDDDDATDADEMTTFDGSTISLSLSPIMTPAKQGNKLVKSYLKVSVQLLVYMLFLCQYVLLKDLKYLQMW